MKRVIFRCLFWALWPLTWFYAPLRIRPRLMVVVDDYYLAVKPCFGGGGWQLPGGGRRGNELLKSAAVRELKEEVGILVNEDQVFELMSQATYIEYGLMLRYAVFVIRLKNRPQVVCNRELLTYAWLSIANKQKLLPHIEQSLNALKQSNLLQ